MRKSILIVFSVSTLMFFLDSTSNKACAQGMEKEGKTTANASQVYLEVGGAGIIYSVNYDGRFSKYENGLGMRVGVGGASVDGDGYFALPVQVNYLAGSKGQYFEIGAGFTYFTASFTDFFDNPTGSNSTVAGTMTIGFRKTPFGKKGITWRVAFTPFIKDGFLPYGGASIGYRF